MGANILFLLTSIPLITIGPGLLALCRICCSIIRGEGISTARDYFSAFKSYFFPGLIVSFALLPLISWSGLMAAGYLLAGSDYWIYTCLMAGLFLICHAVAMYFIPLMAHTRIGVYLPLKNALMLISAGGWRSLIGTISSAAIGVAVVALLPKTLPLLVFIHFSFLCYHASFFAWPVLEEYVFTNEYADF